MKVYLASWFSSKEEIQKKAKELEELGITVTSRWLKEKVANNVQIKDLTEDYHFQTAVDDIEDIMAATKFVVFTPDPAITQPSSEGNCSSWARGGRHFETGFAFALALFWPQCFDIAKGPREVVVSGIKESTFHFLANRPVYTEMKQFPTWEQTKEYLRLEAEHETQSRTNQ